jgi:hypothetical protein
MTYESDLEEQNEELKQRLAKAESFIPQWVKVANYTYHYKSKFCLNASLVQIDGDKFKLYYYGVGSNNGTHTKVTQSNNTTLEKVKDEIEHYILAGNLLHAN